MLEMCARLPIFCVCSDVLYQTETSVFSWPSKVTKVNSFTLFNNPEMSFIPDKQFAYVSLSAVRSLQNAAVKA